MIDNYWAALAIIAGVPPPQLPGQYSGQNAGRGSKVWGCRSSPVQSKVAWPKVRCLGTQPSAVMWLGTQRFGPSTSLARVSRSLPRGFQHFISSCECGHHYN